jgi:PAS domain S-box-containing protein
MREGILMEKHHSCLNTRAIIQYFNLHHPDAVSKLLANMPEDITGLADPVTFLVEINNWVSSDVVIKMFENARQITGDPGIAYAIGLESAVRRKFSYIHRIVLAAYGNPRRSLRRVQKINDRFNRNKRLELLETTRDSAVLRLHWIDGIPASEDFCLFNKGIYSGIPTLWDLPPAVLDESCCYFHGAPYCQYHLKWMKRFSLKEALLDIALPWRTVKYTIAELENDKDVLRQKFDETHRLNLNLESKISELMALQNELEESESRLRALLDRIPGVAIQGFTPDGTVHFWNRASEEIYGYRADEAMGRSISELIIPDDFRETFNNGLARSIDQTGNTEFIASGEYLRHSKNGEPVAVHAVHTVANVKDRAPVLFMFELDIRERKRADEERMRLDKMESLGVLAGGIAHDFNNLLTVILGNIGLASLSTVLPIDARERLKEAEKACLQAQTLSKRLLTFSKGGLPVKEPCNLSDLIEEASQLALSGSSSRAAISLQVGLWPVDVDRGQMHQVFGNLIINADQAMPEGGTVRINAENVILGKNSDMELSAGNYVKIAISDEGMGIPSKYLGKIFDPYFTTKQKGSGLGLATVYSIIRNHRGVIRVSSEVGASTTFVIYLPAAAFDVRERTLVEDEPVTGRGRVLLMDDEDALRDVVGQMIQRLGYEVVYAKEGGEAIRRFRAAMEASQGFAAVIADLTVPGGMGGRDCVRGLLEIDPEIKVIASSGYSDDPVMSDFKSYGFSGAIVKPFRIAELSRVLMDAAGK